MACEGESGSNSLHLPETLAATTSTSSLMSSSASSLPLDDQVDSSSSPPADLSPADGASSSPKPLPKSFSFSRLNAEAPAFIPRSSSTSSLSVMSTGSVGTSPAAGTTLPTTKQQTSFVIPHPPGPPTLVHVYATTSPVPSPSSSGPAGLFATHLPPVQGTYAGPGYQLPAVQYNRPYYGGVGQQQDLLATVPLAPQPLTPAAVAALTAPTQGDSDKGAGTSTVSGAAMGGPKSGLSEEASQKIVNQVEYYFGDLNLATTDHLIRFMNKDPEGYVPISVVASFKKIKGVISSNSQLANILRSSEKLVVSEDGKKVKRLHRLTESDMEELQCRIVVAENLPEDHCHQSLMKIFSTVGRVKTIRTCQPQNANSSASTAARAAKTDGMHFSYKLHAFVEYESVELAEKAVVELNDEKNWRNGLKVRLLHRPKAKLSQGRTKKTGHENDCDAYTPEDSDANDLAGEDDCEQKRSRNRGRGKGRGRPQFQSPNHRGSITGPSPSVNILASNEQLMTNKLASVPRMPDGTKGFSMGRGKPVAISTA